MMHQVSLPYYLQRVRKVTGSSFNITRCTRITLQSELEIALQLLHNFLTNFLVH